MKPIAYLLSIVVISLFFFTAVVLAEEWAGADDKAEEAITKIDPNYEPWFSPIWEPPSGEIESLLFSLQAAIGALIIGYVMGYYKAKRGHVRDV